LEHATKALLALRYSGLKSFDQLHGRVEGSLGEIAGIGPLTIYDMAHRLGNVIGHAPQQVYLHAGTRAGAKALGVDYRKKRLPVDAFPKEFHRLRPEQIEDCLCIYKDRLRRLATIPS
jgi:hypothetical protein